VVVDLDGDGASTWRSPRPTSTGRRPSRVCPHLSSVRDRQLRRPGRLRHRRGSLGPVRRDVNADGRPDLVAATPATVAPQIDVVGDTGGISLLRQDSIHPGSFLPSQWLDTGGAATDAAIAQLTDDGLADVVVADGVLRNGRALLLAQNPALPGTFLAPLTLQAGSGNGSDDLAVGDVDGDGRDDVVLAASTAVAVLYRNAGGGFDRRSSWPQARGSAAWPLPISMATVAPTSSPRTREIRRQAAPGGERDDPAADEPRHVRRHKRHGSRRRETRGDRRPEWRRNPGCRGHFDRLSVAHDAVPPVGADPVGRKPRSARGERCLRWPVFQQLRRDRRRRQRRTQRHRRQRRADGAAATRLGARHLRRAPAAA